MYTRPGRKELSVTVFSEKYNHTYGLSTMYQLLTELPVWIFMVCYKWYNI